jgi:hypothetical protein
MTDRSHLRRESIAIVNPDPLIHDPDDTPQRPVDYPPAPDVLSERQAELWRQITRSKPADWWDAGSLPVLRALVCHIDTCELVQLHFAAVGSPGDPDALDRLERLARLRERESKSVASLSTKLRLTQQSRYTPLSARTAERRPHELPDWQHDPLLARFGL